MIDPLTVAVAVGIITSATPVAVEELYPSRKQQIINATVLLPLVLLGWVVVGVLWDWELLFVMVFVAYGVNQALGHAIYAITEEKEY